MTFTLTEYFDDYIEIEGTRYALNLSYDNVLRVLELFRDKDFSKEQRLEIAFDMLVIGTEDLDIDLHGKDQIVSFILQDFLEIEFKSNNSPKYYDLTEDAAYIYASFLQDYGIDLIEQQGKLHWKKFNALLSSLSDDTKFRKVVEIRRMKIPPLDKHNAEQRDAIIKAKQAYRLRGKEDPHLIADRIDNTLDQVAAIFKPRG
ncbi:Gp15 family bacteriophage protein [Bacillus sonorensis]|uniref:Gp15 family bacteriophage protein n=1 Tax=Bacillus sonorensis TaxID=119858 RepID=UPI00098A2C2C|nr:Gp15 family bacteriophage protein [Bacillus sonorensis]